MTSLFQVSMLGFCLAFVSDGARPGATPDHEFDSPPAAIVIGFVGGFVHHDDRVHAEVQLADRLREEFSPSVAVQLFENHNGKDAHKSVLRLLHANRDGAPSPEEKQSARIIIFGHSWGASETVELARKLQNDGVPVLLTIQVDSISKFGQNDTVIPPNVAQAVNFYQHDGWLHGKPKIRAADASHTRILGNFRSGYKGKPFSCGRYPWYDRIFMKPHIQIECDPEVWSQVESLIRANLTSEASVLPANGPAPAQISKQ
jgi:pimeloyl-ACP methyl ester carboxylesterase